MRKATLLLLGLSLLLPLAGTAHAAAYWTAETVTLAPDRTVDENLMIAGGTVLVHGTVNGDGVFVGRDLNLTGTIGDNLVAAGRTIMLEGRVEGDVFAAGQKVSFTRGSIGDLRAAGQTVRVDGEVRGDVLAAAASVHVARGALITGDLVVGAGEVFIEGEVQGDVIGGVGNLHISGTVLGNVEVDIEELHFERGGRVEGNVIYGRVDPLQEDYTVHIGGRVEQRDVKERDRFDSISMPMKLWALVSGLAAAFVLLALMRRRIMAAADDVAFAPARSLLWGFLAFVAVPVASLIAMLLIVGIPIAFMALALYGVLVYASWLLGGLILGRELLKRIVSRDPSPWVAVLLGLVLLTLIGMIPVVGTLLCLLVTLTALGGVVMQIVPRR